MALCCLFLCDDVYTIDELLSSVSVFVRSFVRLFFNSPVFVCARHVSVLMDSKLYVIKAGFRCRITVAS